MHLSRLTLNALFVSNAANTTAFHHNSHYWLLLHMSLVQCGQHQTFPLFLLSMSYFFRKSDVISKFKSRPQADRCETNKRLLAIYSARTLCSEILYINNVLNLVLGTRISAPFRVVIKTLGSLLLRNVTGSFANMQFSKKLVSSTVYIVLLYVSVLYFCFHYFKLLLCSRMHRM